MKYAFKFLLFTILILTSCNKNPNCNDCIKCCNQTTFMFYKNDWQPVTDGNTTVLKPLVDYSTLEYIKPDCSKGKSYYESRYHCSDTVNYTCIWSYPYPFCVE